MPCETEGKMTALQMLTTLGGSWKGGGDLPKMYSVKCHTFLACHWIELYHRDVSIGGLSCSSSSEVNMSSLTVTRFVLCAKRTCIGYIT